MLHCRFQFPLLDQAIDFGCCVLSRVSKPRKDMNQNPDPADRALHVYDPGTIKVMAAALDTACEILPTELRENASARRRLAFRIIRLVDDGERDPQRIADSVVASMIR
jgi:hypothetical protein